MKTCQISSEGQNSKILFSVLQLLLKPTLCITILLFHFKAENANLIF